MVLFCVLLIILFVLAFIAVLALGIGGGFGVVIFGDLIVCIAIIIFLIRIIRRIKNRRN